MNGYVFNVRIYPVSKYDDTIEEIRDNYCWKYLNIKTKEWFRNELAGILPQEYKFILHSMYQRSYFDDDKNIKLDLPLEEYYETRDSLVPLTLEIVIPPNVLSQNTGGMEEDIKKTINDFYKNNPNSSIEFYLSQTKTCEDYEKINVRSLENSHFYLHREWKNVWDIVDIENIIEIKIGQED